MAIRLKTINFNYQILSLKKSVLILFLFTLSAFGLHAQIKGFYDGNTYYIEEIIRNPPLKKSTYLSFNFGPSNYLGDLGGNEGISRKFINDNNFKKRTFFYGVSLSYLRKEALGLRLTYTAGQLAGSDRDVEYKTKNDNAYTRYKRNLDFRTKINEGSMMIEVFPFKFVNYRKSIHQWNFQPYLIGGLAVFSFNPQGSYFDEIADDYVWVDLKPLRTEGQGMKEYPTRKPYQLTQINIPFGAGVRYEVGNKTSLSVEFIGRHLYTDYLDDVSTNYIDPNNYSTYFSGETKDLATILNNKSNIIDPDNPYVNGQQRGNPQYNDFYYSMNIKLSVRISKLKVPNFLRKQYKYDNNEICD